MPPECSRPLLVALVCVAVAAAVTGCGDDSGEPTSSSTTTTSGEPAEATPLRRELERELVQLIEAGDANVDAQCVVDELRTTLSNDLVEAATEAANRGEEIPQEAIDAAYAAGQACTRG